MSAPPENANDPAPWLVLRGDRLLCTRCGDEHPIDVPKPLPDFIAEIDSFRARHGACKEAP